MFNVALNENYGLLNGTINNKVLDYTYGTNQNVTWLKDSITNYELEMIYGSNKIESLNYGGTPTQFDYEYDLNGNVLKDHKAQYNYDSKNNLEFSKTKIKVNGSETTVLTKYYYNGLNQRIAKEIQGGQIKYFVYNENDQVIGEYDNNGNVINEYVYFGLRPVAVRTGVNINIVHTDYLGSPRIITSGTNGGSTVWEWKNDNPYGNNKATGSIEFNLRFAGQYYDSESGLHYNINRTYDPEVGRYMQSDPIGLSGGSNTYNYVNRNPLSNVAPLGLSKRDILKMREIFNISVKEMIQKDMMLPGDNSDTNYGFGDNNNEIAYSCNPLLKGQKSFLLSRECSEKDTKKTICYQQASYVHNKLIDNIKHFDDKWKIIQQSNNSHDWVVAIPLNPT